MNQKDTREPIHSNLYFRTLMRYFIQEEGREQMTTSITPNRSPNKGKRTLLARQLETACSQTYGAFLFFFFPTISDFILPTSSYCMNGKGLPSELLLKIFGGLRSRSLVRAREISKSWLQTINQSSSFWREVELVGDLEEEVILTTLELFNEKSKSTLREVLVEWNSINLETSDAKLIELLERSSRTLTHLTIHGSGGEGGTADLTDLTWKLSKLVDFRLQTERNNPSTFSVKLLEDNQRNEERQDSPGPVSTLKLLWFPGSEELFDSRLHLLNNLSSLSVEWTLSSSDWRKILEPPSNTLKHLKMRYEADRESLLNPPAPLKFPRLQILETHPDIIFPSWLQMQSTTLIFHNNMMPSSLPSGISKLWLRGLSNEQRLFQRCPLLTELRLFSLGSLCCDRLMILLRERNENLKSGLEVDGIQMVAVAKVFVRASDFTSRDLEELGQLVEEVGDIEELSRTVEVTI